jgi:putative transposase
MAVNRGLSLRRSCVLLDFPRSCLSYAFRMPAKDAPYIEAMRRHAALQPRFGYRRIRLRLLAEGFSIGKEKALRLWRKADLLVPRKRPRKRPARSSVSPYVATAVNEIWAYDFVHDGCANGQTLKCLTVLDEYSREALAIDVGGSIRSERVIEVLSRLISEHGLPKALRSDNGPEFVSSELKAWAEAVQLPLVFISPGKPWQNAFNESFNGKFRDECLSVEWFRNRREARVVIEHWRREYNMERPHSSLENVPPAEFARRAQRRSSACHGPCKVSGTALGPPSRQGPRHASPVTSNPGPIQN